jgi:hypothetical protein
MQHYHKTLRFSAGIFRSARIADSPILPWRCFLGVSLRSEDASGHTTSSAIHNYIKNVEILIATTATN